MPHTPRTLTRAELSERLEAAQARARLYASQDNAQNDRELLTAILDVLDDCTVTTAACRGMPVSHPAGTFAGLSPTITFAVPRALRCPECRDDFTVWEIKGGRLKHSTGVPAAARGLSLPYPVPTAVAHDLRQERCGGNVVHLAHYHDAGEAWCDGQIDSDPIPAEEQQ